MELKKNYCFKQKNAWNARKFYQARVKKSKNKEKNYNKRQ